MSRRRFRAEARCWGGSWYVLGHHRSRLMALVRAAVHAHLYLFEARGYYRVVDEEKEA